MSLSTAELDCLRENLGREPYPSEIVLFDALWSEHCSYKSSKHILEKYLPVTSPAVVVGPGEDAGIVRLTPGPNSLCLVVSHESHNHPSQILPYEGAATGIGGIVRDVYCMGAEVVGVMDCLRFGNPDGDSGGKVREIASGVVEGIWQYANALGVPNLGGDLYFDGSFDRNCIVNVIAVGVLRENEIVRSRIPARGTNGEYALILVGKPADATGVGGASFASRKLGDESLKDEKVSVQIPDPFLKRILALATREALDLVRQRGMEAGMKDLGAGGIGCAFSEIALAGNRGVFLDLDKIPLEEELPPSLILTAETQERYVLAVPAEIAEDVCRVYNSDFSLPALYKGAQATVVGKAVDESVFVAVSKGREVCDFPIGLVKACPPGKTRAEETGAVEQEPVFDEPSDIDGILRMLASSRNLCSREYLYRFYDTEVQGRAILRPGESDAVVFLPDPGLSCGVCVGVGGNPFYGNINPFWGGALAVSEAMRNVVASGGLPLALTDCLNFGNPEDDHTMWQFGETVRGMGEAARGIGNLKREGEPVPFVSGNVSLHNYTELGAVPPCPVVACYGLMDDYSRACTLSLKEKGNVLLLIGQRKPELGGSAYLGALGIHGGKVPRVDFASERASYAAVLDGIQNGLFISCHDISDGGLGIALLEMCFASMERGLGIDANTAGLRDGARTDFALFTESPGFVVEVGRSSFDRALGHLEKYGVKGFALGSVTGAGRMRLVSGGEELADIRVDDVFAQWNDGLKRILS